MRGSSFVRSIKRVGSLPVQSPRYFLGMLKVSSPVIESSRSVITAVSLRPPIRASAMMAADFPIRMDNPNCAPRFASVGPHTLVSPSNIRMTRPIVPFPDRLGPTSIIIFWR